MRPAGYQGTQISASTKLADNGGGHVRGFYVSSTTSGTIKIWDNSAASGTVLLETATPAVGWHDLGGIAFGTGLYVTLANTIEVTIVWTPPAN